MSEAVIVTLSSPIEAHRETLTELTIRPPTGKDIRLDGYPLTFNGSGGSSMDAAITAKLIARLAGIPPLSVDALTAGDFQSCMTAIMGFFAVTAPPASSNDTSKSPAGGATSGPSST